MPKSSSLQSGRAHSPHSIPIGGGSEGVSGPLNRSCEPCRAAKVRCQFESDAVGTRCQRCRLTNRSCVLIARLARKPRKRTDTRIKELEQKLLAMETNLLKPATHPGSFNGSSPVSRSSSNLRVSGTRRRAPGSIDASDDAYVAQCRSPPIERSATTGTCSDTASSDGPEDFVDRGLVSFSEADELFNRFVDYHMAEYPLVVFPRGITSEEIRSSKPILFLAVVAAASGSSDQTTFRALNVELLKEFADKIMIKSTKDLELVQAMLVMAAWYFPPDRFEDLKHYQYIHMAATMAMDIGLCDVGDAMPPSASRPQSLAQGSPASVVEADTFEVERHRTLLSCYLLCAGVSLSMDRPNLLRFTPFMERSLSYLRESSHAAPTDKKLAVWVDLQILSEEVADAFRRGRTDIVSFEDAQIRNQTERLSQKFEVWWKHVDKDILDNSMTIAYHYNKARVFEVVLYANHNLEDLRPPFLIRSSHNIKTHRLSLTPAYIRTLFKLIHEAQRCIDTFCGMDLETVRSAPVMHYIRCFYCLTILLNLHILCQRPDSDLNKVLEADTLQIEEILQRWQNVCNRAAGQENCRSPAKFGLVLAKVYEWLHRETAEEGHENHGDLRPLTLINAKQVANTSPSNLQMPATRASSGKQPESPAGFINVARTSHCPAIGQFAGSTPSMDWNPPHSSSMDNDSATVDEWFNQSTSGPFFPMELDQSAIAFFEAMSSDVAHSSVPPILRYTEDATFDNLMYQ